MTPGAEWLRRRALADERLRDLLQAVDRFRRSGRADLEEAARMSVDALLGPVRRRPLYARSDVTEAAESAVEVVG